MSGHHAPGSTEKIYNILYCIIQYGTSQHLGCGNSTELPCTVQIEVFNQPQKRIHNDHDHN